jgi:hypothetical protein
MRLTSVQTGHTFSHREKAGMRENKIRGLSCFDPHTLTLSGWERELAGQQWF